MPAAVPLRRHHLQDPKLLTDTSKRNADIYSHRYALRPRPYLRRSYNENNIGQAQAMIALQSGFKHHVANHVFHPTSGAKESLDKLRE